MQPPYSKEFEIYFENRIVKLIKIFMISAIACFFIFCIAYSLTANKVMAFIDFFSILIILYNYYVVSKLDFRKIKKVTLLWIVIIIYISILIVWRKIPIVFIWFIPFPLMLYIAYSLEVALYGMGLAFLLTVSTPMLSDFFNLHIFFNCTDATYLFLTILNIVTAVYFCFLFLYFTNEIRDMEKEFIILNNEVLKEDVIIEKNHSSSAKIDTKLEKLYDTILVYFETEKPYTNPEFNINMLSKALHSNVGYISRTLNQKTNKNFICFVNEYRINEVLLQFNKKDHLKFTIKHIYTKAGFSNQSTFNRIFKQNIGIKPSEYLDSLR